MFRNLFSLSNLTLLVALALSSVAAYYSIIGLTAIFAGAVIPIIVMGSILEVGKITTTVWLRKYWSRASWIIKCYLVPAVVLLAFLTSMGIFGFLSKAHTDQGLVSGDSQAKLALYDEKIKYPFDKLVENIIHTFKFYHFDVPYEDVKHEVVAFLNEKIHKYNDPTKGKAFSYFSIIELKILCEQDVNTTW